MQSRLSSWRRESRARLRSIEALPDHAARWAAMTGLLRLVGPRGTNGRPPDGVFRPPDRVSVGDHAALREHLRRSLGR